MRFILLILLVQFLSLYSFADEKFDRRLEKLVLRAKVLETRIDRTDEKYPRAELKLEVTFTNEGNEPIIILQKIGKDSTGNNLIFPCGLGIYGKSYYGNYFIQNNCALPSVCRGCNENLAKILDQKSPPENYTKILKPKESYTLIQETFFGMPLKTSSGMYGWDEIAENDWKVGGSITYSMFPINLGRYGEKFGYKLQKRWKKFGILYVGDTHSLITSEKFEIDLTDLKF